MRVKLLGAAAVVARAACSPTTNAPAGNAAAALAPLPGGDWAKFRDTFIADWFVLDPANAVYQGKHEFDGKLADWRAAGLKAPREFLRAAITRAQAFDATRLSKAVVFVRV